MIELTRSIGWSCDLHMFQRTRSRIVESTRPLSPFFQYERQIDLEVPVFASAAGLAVLSTWQESAVLALVDEIGDDPHWGLSRLGMTKRSLLSVLKQVRTNGYSMRVPEYRGQSALANTLTAIARPVFRGPNAVGALVLLWPKGYLAHDRFAELHLPRLQEAASAASTDLSQLDQG